MLWIKLDGHSGPLRHHCHEPVCKPLSATAASCSCSSRRARTRPSTKKKRQCQKPVASYQMYGLSLFLAEFP